MCRPLMLVLTARTHMCQFQSEYKERCVYARMGCLAATCVKCVLNLT
jgi:hypothetical protein